MNNLIPNRSILVTICIEKKKCQKILNIAYWCENGEKSPKCPRFSDVQISFIQKFTKRKPDR